ncbi:MAG: pyridoxal phosphate-dependent aminotransferase [Haliangiales bacterium]
MYAETRYLTWANRIFGTVTHNLARGGMSPVPLSELGAPPRLDDSSAWTRVRDHIARYNAVRAEETLPALGATHALWMTFAALVSPGDDVLVENPGYEPLWRIPEGMGANIRWFERTVDSGFALDVDAVARRLTPETKVVVVTHPHNPSGVGADPAALTALARRCGEVGATLLVDEIYAPFGAPLGSDGVWGQTARHLDPNIVAVSGLSKAYGLGALRVGWLLGDEALIRRGDALIQSNLGDPPIAQMCVAAHAFASLEALSRAREAHFTPELRAEVARWVAARPGLWWREPAQGPFGLVCVPGAADLTADIERGAAQHDVLVAPGAFFGIPNGFRLGWSVKPEQLAPALERLDQLLAPALERTAGAAPGATSQSSDTQTT